VTVVQYTFTHNTIKQKTHNGMYITIRIHNIQNEIEAFFGKPFVEPKEISTASVRDLCLFIRETGIMNLCC
jgi:hypothetical protein